MRHIKKERHRYREIWGSRGFVVSLLVMVLFISVSVTKEVLRRVETRYEIQKLEEEVERLGSRNSEISDVIALLNTTTTQDKQARVKLNHQQAGEQVLMFPDRRQDAEIILPNSDRIDYILLNNYESNPSKWFNFFWNKITNTS